MEHKLTNSLDLLIGPDSRADIDSEYSDTMNNKNRGFLKGNLNLGLDLRQLYEAGNGLDKKAEVMD